MLLLVQGYVNLAPRLLLEELFYRIEQAPSWNPTLVECRTVQVPPYMKADFEKYCCLLLVEYSSVLSTFMGHSNAKLL
jgi:hypothetical protein